MYDGPMPKITPVDEARYEVHGAEKIRARAEDEAERLAEHARLAAWCEKWRRAGDYLGTAIAERAISIAVSRGLKRAGQRPPV